MLQTVLRRLRNLSRTPNGAAVLSFLFPGLGQAAAGKRNRGAIVAIPALAVLGVFGLIVLLERRSLVDHATNDQWLFSLLILDLLALIYHLWAVADAYVLARRQRRASPLPQKWMAIFAIVVLVSGTIGIHAALASFIQTTRNSAACLQGDIPCFLNNWDPNATADPSVSALPTDQGDTGVEDTSSPGAATPTAPPSVGPLASLPYGLLPDSQTTQDSKDWAKDGQLNVLLLGVDQAPDKNNSRAQGLRTDTMILLQIDLQTGRSAMYGLARNLYCIPMPKQIAVHYPNPYPQYACPAGTYGNDMLNGLWTEAAKNHPSYFPFYPGKDAGNSYMRGIMALEQGIGALTGVHVDGSVVINLPGFVALIDALGGIDINVPTKLVDHPCGPKGTPQNKYGYCKYVHYGYGLPDGSKDISFVINPGQQHMDGQTALMYARSRYFDPQGDYGRMMRQQLVIRSIRDTLNPCALLPRVGDLVTSLGQALWTDMPLGDASALAGLAQHISGSNVGHFSLDPKTLHSPAGTTMIDAAGWATAKSIVAHGLDKAPAATSGSGSGGGGFSC
jgi:anionic cell wall polymer biosynthesis LytR-Cps2A-Psr (LCP) family protein